MDEKPNSDNAADAMMLVPGMTHDLGGGFVIRRLLPYRKKRMVGPFIFLDHMGPVEFSPTRDSDIRPHPHIGLSTLTYLYEGRMVHRDSLGWVQTILPGEVNWMTAGSGIVHSERAHGDDYGKPTRMQGLQFWVALPDETEDQKPSFRHYDKNVLPIFKGEDFTATLVVGESFGLTSPVAASSPMIFVDIKAEALAEIKMTPEKSDFEIAVYVVTGRLIHRGAEIEAGQLAILPNATDLNLLAKAPSHFIIIGGEAFKKPRYIWWNFVSSSHDKIEAAKKAWSADALGKVPGETERIPLGE